MIAELMPFTPKTRRLIGRKAEMKKLESFLHKRGNSHFVYIVSGGGYGKTRLLEEVARVANEAGPGFHTTRIIDLYHTDTHATSDLEQLIVADLGPSVRFFDTYLMQRDRYEALRERGAGVSVLEDLRKALSEAFVEGMVRLSTEAEKLVILFDTFELLQFETSVVEETEELNAVNARIIWWLTKILPRLRNVLVVFAGRPHPAGYEASLIDELRAAFGKDFHQIELGPLSLDEARELIAELPDGPLLLPEEALPVAHRLTSGRPIFLHLLLDWFRLCREPAQMLEWFRQRADLADPALVPNDDPRLIEAREETETKIIELIYTGTPPGLWLAFMGVLAKGFNAEILHAISIPKDMAEDYITQLRPLSFVKEYKRDGAERRALDPFPHENRLFFHDEVYRLLELKPLLREQSRFEKMIANQVVNGYYTPRIDELQREVDELQRQLATPGRVLERVQLRRTLQKLQVERLYYFFVLDPREGYAEYRRLSNIANRTRSVGFGMRLLDEFLRFYNRPGHHELFAARGITEEQVTRDSVRMWVERLHWWGMYKEELEFAPKTWRDPVRFNLDLARDVTTLSHMYALWARAHAMTYRYDAEVNTKAKWWLDQLPPIQQCDPDQALARARLSTSIGYEYRQGGYLNEAVAQDLQAKTAFRQANLALPEGYRYADEMAILLQNLAYVYARQGRLSSATPLALESLELQEQAGSEYSKGLTLCTLARIETRRGNHEKSLRYCEEALRIFQGIEDPHGVTTALLAQGEARRKMGKSAIDERRELEDAALWLQEAERVLKEGLNETGSAGLGALQPELLSELAKVYRELGRLRTRQGRIKEGTNHYIASESYFDDAAEGDLSPFARADTLEDWAELKMYRGVPDEAEAKLLEVEQLVPQEYHILETNDCGTPLPATEYFWPLGKVERLRGQMAFDLKEYAGALQHALLAYTYFIRFSPEAQEQHTTIRITYEALGFLPMKRQEELLSDLRGWAEDRRCLEYASFFGTLEGLLGA